MPYIKLILTLFVILPQTTPPEYVPAGDEAYTLDLELDGYDNGAMDSDRLMTFDGCTLERDAAYLYALMWEAAKSDGVTLRPQDCYRTYNRQVGAYERRCPFKNVAVYDKDPVTGETWMSGTRSVRICTGPPTAKPGQSNHGWGRAIDFRTRRGGSLGCDSPDTRWLQGNAHRFGWVNPRWAWCDRDTAEPWHWEYAGVTDPSLVNYGVINEKLAEHIE